MTRDGIPWYKQLHWQVALAMIFGTLAGLVGGQALADKIGWIGQLFIKLLKMIIVPLVLTSIISGVASVGGSAGLGRLYWKDSGLLRAHQFSCGDHGIGAGQHIAARCGSRHCGSRNP